MPARSVGTGRSSSTAASGRFGVIRSASGTRQSRTAAMPASSTRVSPLLATITGSSTTQRGRRAARPSRIVSATSRLATMPIFTASMATSSSRVSSWAAMKSAGTGCTPVTPRVFCAVSAVITLVP